MNVFFLYTRYLLKVVQVKYLDIHAKRQKELFTKVMTVLANTVIQEPQLKRYNQESTHYAMRCPDWNARTHSLRLQNNDIKTWILE